MKAVNIKWDVDYDEKYNDLPTEVEIPEELTDPDIIGEWLTNTY